MLIDGKVVMSPEDDEERLRICAAVLQRYCAEQRLRPEELTDEQREEIADLYAAEMEASELAEKYGEDYRVLGLRATMGRWVEAFGPLGALEYFERLTERRRRAATRPAKKP